MEGKNMETKYTIASLMLNWRKRKRYTQFDVAEMFDTNQANISKIENGLRNIPREKVDWFIDESGLSSKVVNDAWFEMDQVYGAEVL
jgi:transcriptional regulator with XRE-family HTH domain